MKEHHQLRLELLSDEPEPAHGVWLEDLGKFLKIQTHGAWPDQFGDAIREWFDTQYDSPIRTLSLFSGAGGLDIGFHDAGFNIVEMVEIESQFASTLKANTLVAGRLKGAKVNCIDIREYVPPNDLTIDFIIGGPPCQTFSAAGRRAAGVKGTSDARGVLFQEYVRILEALNPKGFLFENVYGITGANGGADWKEIQRCFAEAGYDLYYRVLDAADYGVPQHRERLIIVGVRKGDAPFHFPSPTHGPDSPDRAPYYTAQQAVYGAQITNEDSLGIKGRWGHLIDGIPPGLNYSFYTAEMGHPRPVFAWRSKFSDFMYKADPEMPVRTIKAQGGLYTGPFSWENRHFSSSELKRLQTFPDDYNICGSRGERIKQIGNSVPPQFARVLALAVATQLFDRKLPVPIPLMHPSSQLGFRTRKRQLSARYSRIAKKAISTLPDSQTAAKERELSHEYQAFLSKSFDFNCKENHDSAKFKVIQRINQEFLELQCIQDSRPVATSHFQLDIVPSGTGWVIPLQSIIAQGFDLSPETFTATWKAIERAVFDAYDIDDLVQLCGYYQYQPRFRASLKLPSYEDPLWKIVSQIVSGEGVGRQLFIDEYAALWGVDERRAVEVMHFLRILGFEVRNHNTNPQIADGRFLVPYGFPTLTSRSVQLRKVL